MTCWLLQEDALRQLREAYRVAPISIEEQRAHIESEQKHVAERGPRSLSLAGENAEIRVAGILTKKPDIWAWFFGLENTSYADLLAAIATVRASPDVKSVRLTVDSPGGSADGLFDVLGAIETLREEKTVTVLAENAYSAAYGIAAAAGKIDAQNHGSMFGSVGVAARYAQWADVDVWEITNTESPDKRPDPSTEGGRAVIRRELDAIFDLFVAAIAKGRDTTKEHVIENFGRGASFVARDAQRRGMIDTVRAPALRAVVSASTTPEAKTETTAANPGGADKKENPMSTIDKKTLRLEHPELYETVVQEGVEKERKRVCAHLKLGQRLSAMEVATKAIESGASTMDEDIHGEYLAAGLNRNDREARQLETDEAAEKTKRAAAKPSGTDAEARIMDLVDRELGVVRKGA